MPDFARIRKRYPTIGRGYDERGASMGRDHWRSEPAARSVRLFHLPIDSQGYDPGGAYWGVGRRLYCATDCEEYRAFVRADSREDAIRELGIARVKLTRG